jgi:arylsulfatase A-like enzyme
VRTSRWKLIHFWEQPQEWELYDLWNDPDETQNLAYDRQRAGVVAELKKRLAELRRESGDVDAAGPAPISKPCGKGVNTFYANPPK